MIHCSCMLVLCHAMPTSVNHVINNIIINFIPLRNAEHAGARQVIRGYVISESAVKEKYPRGQDKLKYPAHRVCGRIVVY